MNWKRYLLVLVILLPYKLIITLNKIEVSIYVDIMVAIVAFGLGYAFFPDKKRNPRFGNDKDVLDNDSN
jgi:hypothetical protein